MQFARTLCATLLLTAAMMAPAAAQLYPGDGITVNPSAIGRGYLLYPGGRFGRAMRNLRQPGERPGAVVHLHMPGPHHVVTAHPPRRIASAPPAHAVERPLAAPAPPMSSDVSSLPEDSAARLVDPSTMGGPAAPPPAKPARTAALTRPLAGGGATAIPFSFAGSAAMPPPRRTANTMPSGAAVAGLKKQSMIPFAAGQSSPAAGDVNAIHSLATTLNAALAAGATRVQLEAYGGPHGDKSSDSRRLSLKRALVVRELLIEDGVPSEKIDVRALGGADDSGAADRVDVFVRA